MEFSDEDNILIKNLYDSKEYAANIANEYVA